MKKYFFLAIAILLVVFAVSCRNYVLVPVYTSSEDGGGGGSGSLSQTFEVADYNELSIAVLKAKDGDSIVFEDGFSVPITAETIKVTKNLNLSGDIGIVGNTSGTGSITTMNAIEPKIGGTFTLFNVVSGTLNLSGLTVTVDENVEIESIITISGAGKVNVGADTTFPSTVVAISIDATVTDAGCITGTISSNITINIAPDSPIEDEIIESNPDAGITVGGMTDTERVAGFMEALSIDAISEYMIANSPAIMEAFGITKDSNFAALANALYDKLQSGAVIQFDMSDGGTLSIEGHFDEGETDMWDMTIMFDVPAAGTSECFPDGSGYTVKGGKVTLRACPAEITNAGEKYDNALCIYSYSVKLENVIVDGPSGEFTLDINGLTAPEDWNNPSIIDPNGATMTISVPVFQMPPAETEAAITIDGRPVSWSEIYPLIV